MLTLLPEAIAQYCTEHSHGASAVLRELEQYTRAHEPGANMLSGAHEAALLQMLIRISRARRVLEVGLYTGYSALAMAEALPADGMLISCDMNPHTTAIAQRFFDRSPHGRKIHVRLGPALETLESLAGEEAFDFAFIDADKENYVRYYDRLRSLVCPGGLIVADNTLWSGEVLAPKTPAGLGVAAFNRHVAHDHRAEAVLLPLRDGVSVIRLR
ncbi:MAG TPA: class I SAM-dependent methyltransferase [Acidiferrobacteraceae bacterium]|nr:class I SAM-dependent methyltransferase [Acidiferrobacteraceae bacterium]